MASVESAGSLAVASLDLILVQLLRGAMRTADLSSAAQSQGAPAATAIGDRFSPASGHHGASPGSNVKVVYKPVQRASTPGRPQWTCPVTGRVLPKPFCDTDPTAPAPPATAPASPFQPPWKTLPWPTPRPSPAISAVQLIIRQIPADHVGQMLDLFV